MIYTVLINDRSYDLPKRTIAVTNKLDSAAKVDSDARLTMREKIKKVFDTVSELIGPENMEDAFGSKDLDEIDTTEITLAFRMIVDAYNKPLSDYTLQSTVEELNKLPLEKLSALIETADSLNDDGK